MTWAPNYLTVDEMKSWLRISDTVDDVEITAAIAAASRAVDVCCSRQFGQVDSPEVRTYEGAYDRRERAWSVDVDDIADVTSLAVSIASVAQTSVVPLPSNAVLKGRVYTRLQFDGSIALACFSQPPQIDVTAIWGWVDVPATVTMATRLQASRFLTRRDSPFGVAGSPDQGSELRLLARVDPDVELMLGAYRRHWSSA
jgi:Phage gp6-like head-tail connector protein